MSELKSCPFCGGDDMAVSVDGGVSPGYVDVYQKYVCTCTISCERCHAEIHGYAASNITCDLYDRSVNEAAAAWNTRHVETCTIGDYKDPDYGYTHDAMWNDEWFVPSGRCSGCGEYIPVWNYCPNCGRKVNQR